MTSTNRGNLRWFESDHLPMHLQEIAHPVEMVAQEMVSVLFDPNASTEDSEDQLNRGLAKLLEAKDCFVRAGVRLHETKQAISPEPEFRAKS